MGVEKASEKVKVLLVDDRQENLQALQAVLSELDCESVFARNGEQALKAILTHDFAVILLDVFMEGMDGFEVATLIKKREKSKDIPIIFLTAALSEPDFIFKAYSVGAVDYIQKPIDGRIVRQKVSVFIDLYRKARVIERQAELLRESEIRERERQLEEVKAAEQKRYEDLVEGIDHGFVWSADRDSLHFTYLSPRVELILGYPVSRWQKERDFFLSHIPTEDREAVLATIRDAESGKERSIEHRFINADGETIWLHTGVRLGRKGEGTGAELRGLSLDITALKQMEEALKDSVKIRDEFLSIASHELRTPLTPMFLQLQVLERSLGKEDSMVPREKLTKTLESWRRQIGKLVKLIEDLLDVSRITAGRFSLQPEDTDLRTIADEVAERFSLELEHAGCELKITGADHIPGRWDRLRLEQVLTNLISNAMKYAPGKPVEVELSEKENNVFIAVRDHGPGIPPEQQQRIFERFERANQTESISGLGLGLYIVKSIVDAHGGSISVSSEPGQGARFTIQLPKRVSSGRAA